MAGKAASTQAGLSHAILHSARVDSIVFFKYVKKNKEQQKKPPPNTTSDQKKCSHHCQCFFPPSLAYLHTNISSLLKLKANAVMKNEFAGKYYPLPVSTQLKAPLCLTTL